MDLRQGNITVREVLKVPGAREILTREFPGVCESPVFKLAQGMSLNIVLGRVHGSVPQEKIQDVLNQLKSL